MSNNSIIYRSCHYCPLSLLSACLHYCSPSSITPVKSVPYLIPPLVTIYCLPPSSLPCLIHSATRLITTVIPSLYYTVLPLFTTVPLLSLLFLLLTTVPLSSLSLKSLAGCVHYSRTCATVQLSWTSRESAESLNHPPVERGALIRYARFLNYCID
jgi:hypothetical protein